MKKRPELYNPALSIGSNDAFAVIFYKPFVYMSFIHISQVWDSTAKFITN